MIGKKINLHSFKFLLGIMLVMGFGCTTTPTASDALPASTTGLLVSATTSAPGGKYAPSNIVAIWITDNSDKFVKTLYVKASQRISHLNKWKSVSASNTVDAATGATRAGHGTIYATWNGTDVTKKVVVDGTYKVWMEMTDAASAGSYTTFTFVKGAATQTLTPADGAHFSGISSSWTPLK
jgi:hypothetical protein